MASSSRSARQAATAAALGGLAILVAACGPASSPVSGGGGRPSSGTPGGTTSAQAGSPAADSSSMPATSAPATGPTGGGSSGSGPGGSGPGGSAPCRSASLRVTVGARQGTAGSVYADIDFTNLAAQKCTLYGYPVVSFTAAGGQVGLAAAEDPVHPRELVTLAPGGVASAVLQIGDAGNYSSGQCRPRPVSQLRVYPPNQTASLLTGFGTTACAGPVQQLHVEVVQPGASSS